MSKIDRELMRGAGPVAVLNLLSKGEMYGYELVRSLERESAGVLGMQQSTLYPLLYNLEAKGLIGAQWRDSDSGRRRKYYSLTAQGQKRLADDVEQWKALVEAMTKLGVVGPASGGAQA
jgi:PadR family transcriptional regulator PadR